jgi:hypothetical protein
MTNPSENGDSTATTLDDDPLALDDRVHAADARPVTQPYPTRSAQDELP